MIQAPKSFLEYIYDTELGFRPTNFSIKPVHIANGLARSLTRRSYNSKAFAETLRQWVLDQRARLDREQNPNAKILERYGQSFHPKNGVAPDSGELTNLRRLARDVLAADGAVFTDPDKSSYTLSNEHFISRDPSDNRSGLFVARLLMAGGGKSIAAERIQALLATEADPWTTLALPLLRLASPREEPLGGEALRLATLSDRLFAVDDRGGLCSPTLRRLRASFDRLASFEEGERSKLNSLRRLVLFGCFAIHVHSLSRWSEVISGAPRPPIFLDMLDGERPAVRDASRATLRAAGDAIEGLCVARTQEYLATSYRRRERADRFVSRIEGDQRRLLARVEAQLADGSTDVLSAFAEAYFEIGVELTRGHPINFLTELGRRAGYLAPWSNMGRGGRLQKRYGLTGEFLEILIAATVSPDSPLAFGEFLDRLSETFGIVLGRAEDDAVIRRNNYADDAFGPLVSVSEEDLRTNVDAMRQAVEATGYAKTYADGQTVVTAAPEGFVVR